MAATSNGGGVDRHGESCEVDMRMRPRPSDPASLASGGAAPPPAPCGDESAPIVYELAGGKGRPITTHDL